MSEELSIPIRRVGQAIGTLGWLVEQKPWLKVANNMNGSARGVWLMSDAGKALECLALVSTEDGLERLRRDKPDAAEMGADHPWTDAAWSIVERLAERAEELLTESEHLAETVTVTFTPHPDPAVRDLGHPGQVESGAAAEFAEIEPARISQD